MNYKDERVVFRANALAEAKRLTEKTERKHVVRDDGLRFFVCPLFESGAEGYRHDAGYAALGVLITEHESVQ